MFHGREYLYFMRYILEKLANELWKRKFGVKIDFLLQLSAYLPNFSSSRSDGERFGFRQSMYMIPMLHEMQHRKSITRMKRTMPSTAKPTSARFDSSYVCSATPTTSIPAEKSVKNFLWQKENTERDVVSTKYLQWRCFTWNISFYCVDRAR